MPRIYSNAFFHYTTKEGLLGILKEGFKASYCKEQFKNNKGELRYIGIPMISFCDIPLSLISQILYGEGKYAIGMKRTWGITAQDRKRRYSWRGACARRPTSTSGMNPSTTSTYFPGSSWKT